MEEKILNILIDMQSEMKDMKSNINNINKRLEKLDILESNQEIMKNNMAKMMEYQIQLSSDFLKHKKDYNIKYKELDYRLTRLEA